MNHTHFPNIVGKRISIFSGLSSPDVYSYEIVSMHVLRNGWVTNMDVEVFEDDKSIGSLVLKIKPAAPEYVTVKARQGNFSKSVREEIVKSIVTNGHVTVGYIPTVSHQVPLTIIGEESVQLVYSEKVLYTASELRALTHQPIERDQEVGIDYYRCRTHNTSIIYKIGSVISDDNRRYYFAHATNEYYEWKQLNLQQHPIGQVLNNGRQVVDAYSGTYSNTYYIGNGRDYIAQITGAFSEDIDDSILTFQGKIMYRGNQSASFAVTVNRGSVAYFRVDRLDGVFNPAIKYDFLKSLLVDFELNQNTTQLTTLYIMNMAELDKPHSQGSLAEWIAEFDSGRGVNLYDHETGTVKSEVSLYTVTDETAESINASDIVGRCFNLVYDHRDNVDTIQKLVSVALRH